MALHVLEGRWCEFRRRILTDNVDVKKAFDSVHRKSLNCILWFRGIFARIIDLMTGLYSQAESTMSLGEPFPASLLNQEWGNGVSLFQHFSTLVGYMQIWWSESLRNTCWLHQGQLSMLIIPYLPQNRSKCCMKERSCLIIHVRSSRP